MNWGAFLSTLRTVLADDRTTPRWSDALLHAYTVDAVNDYSLWFPRQMDGVELTVTGGVATLPDDFVDVIYIELPEGTFLERRRIRPGTRTAYLQYRATRYYTVDGGSLKFYGSPADGAVALVTYLATHPVPTSETDEDFEFTVPGRDMELLRMYVRARVYGQVRSKTSMGDRFKSGNAKRDDNPLEPEVSNLMDEYLSLVASRVRGGAINLYRTGRLR